MSGETVTFLHYDWEMLRQDVQVIVNTINESVVNPEKCVIVAPIRGGLIPSTMVSHATGIKVKCCQYQRYDGNDGKPLLYGMTRGYEHIYVIDDITDSGQTISKIREEIACRYSESKLSFYTLVTSTDEVAQDVCSARKVPSNTWTVFPWENI